MAKGGRRAGSGAKRTPTRLRVLRGNPRDKPINQLEPQPPSGTPDPPAWLSPLENEAWETVTTALEPMGIVTLADGPALTVLAQAWAEWREARGTIQDEGAYYERRSEAGVVSLQRHPAVGIASDAWRRIATMLAEFGLTPSARSRLEVAVASDPGRFEQFRRRRRPGTGPRVNDDDDRAG